MTQYCIVPTQVIILNNPTRLCAHMELLKASERDSSHCTRIFTWGLLTLCPAEPRLNPPPTVEWIVQSGKVWFTLLGAFLGAFSHCTADNLIIWLHWQEELSAFLSQIFDARWQRRTRPHPQSVATQTLMFTNIQTWFCICAHTTFCT